MSTWCPKVSHSALSGAIIGHHPMSGSRGWPHPTTARKRHSHLWTSGLLTSKSKLNGEKENEIQRQRVWRESNLALLVTMMTSQLCWRITQRSQGVVTLVVCVTMSQVPVSRSPVSPSLISTTQLHLPSEYVTRQLTPTTHNTAPARAEKTLHLWLISPIFLQRTRIIMGPWGCGCMRGTINQVRIPKLHQEKFLSRDPPPSPCIIQVIKLFRCRNLHLRLALQSPILLQSEIE